MLLIFQDGRENLVISAERTATAIRGGLQQVYVEAVRHLLGAMSGAGPPVPSDDEIEAAAERWAREYAAALGREIADSTRDLAGQVDDIDAVFGQKRVEMIAATEITRAISAAEAWVLLFWTDAGFEVRERIWHTEQDGLVCPVCRPLNRTSETVWRATAPAGPPAHPNCRCWLDYQVG
ncbi:MAG: phage minor head protein [Pseudomonadota bacterium]